jgi:hypothetical protein
MAWGWFRNQYKDIEVVAFDVKEAHRITILRK